MLLDCLWFQKAATLHLASPCVSFHSSIFKHKIMPRPCVLKYIVEAEGTSFFPAPHKKVEYFRDRTIECLPGQRTLVPPFFLFMQMVLESVSPRKLPFNVCVFVLNGVLFCHPSNTASASYALWKKYFRCDYISLISYLAAFLTFVKRSFWWLPPLSKTSFPAIYE